MFDKIKKILCKHEWIKVGGPQKIGVGKFRQTFRCTKCNKIKKNINY